MDLSAQHSNFVIMSYAVSAIALVLLSARIILQDRARQNEISQSTDKP